MAMDLRQVVAAILTFSMFAMIGNVIKREHFDVVEMQIPATTSTVRYNTIKLTKQSLVKLTSRSKVPWNENGEALRPCWNKSSLKGREESKGFITFSLTDGPEYHVSQIADAVVVSRYLGATLVLPDIRGNKPGHKRNFGEIYDVNQFIKSLDGIIKVTKNPPAKVSSGNLTAIVRVPHRVSESYIASNIEPIFRKKRNLRLETYFPTLTMTKAKKTGYLDSYSCLAMFETLHLKSGIQEMVDLMVERLRTLSWTSNGRFIAIDYRVEMLERKKGCRENEGTGIKSCYNAREIGEFLKKIGFSSDTTIYLTQSGWHSSLDALRDIYPKTYTKEAIMPEDKKAKLLKYSESSELEKFINLHICSQSDVFLPAYSSLFYANVAGKRIASGKTQILVPAKLNSASATDTDYVSPYISKKNHFAYSCFC